MPGQCPSSRRYSSELAPIVDRFPYALAFVSFVLLFFLLPPLFLPPGLLLPPRADLPGAGLLPRALRVLLLLVSDASAVFGWVLLWDSFFLGLFVVGMQDE